MVDFATIGGIVVAVGSLVLGFILDGGTVGSLIQINAAILILGGTIGATLTTVSMKEFTNIVKYLRIAFMGKTPSALGVIEQLVDLATIARREGILALEEQLESFSDPFLKSGIQLVVDGVDPELVKNMLETELAFLDERHQGAAAMFDSAGGFAPTMGIIGTVMGLVRVLGNLKDVSTLGPEIASAFIATLYGVSSANVFWIPIATKLKKKHSEESLLREVMIEGVLSIQAGENPKILGQKLKAFLAPGEREGKVQKQEERDPVVETNEA